MNKKILIMAGGTGGHVFPGIAVAHYLQHHQHEVQWLGTLHGLDTKVVPKAGITLHKINIKGLRGKGKLGLLLAPFKIMLAIISTMKVLKQFNPDVVLGMGGYVAGPGGIACWLKRIPLVIHEQNAIPGKTNLILSCFSRTVLQAFANSFQSKVHAITVGNPIRHTICQLPIPELRFAERKGKLRVLIFGGSQGAEALNECVVNLLSTTFAKNHLETLHQVGTLHYESMQQHYREYDFSGKVVAFIDDMAEAYAWADLVICRSGALSVSEIAAAGLFSILVPFPAAVDDHQTANARVLQQANAATVIQQVDLTVSKLLEILQDFSSNRVALLQPALNARKCAQPLATQTVAEKCLEVAK